MSALGARVRARPGLIALLCCLAVVGTTAWWQVGGDAAAAPSTVVLRDPGSVLKGPLTLFVTTSVPPAQVASIEFQAAPSGTDQWAPIANATGAVLSAPLDTIARELDAALTRRSFHDRMSAQLADG